MSVHKKTNWMSGLAGIENMTIWLWVQTSLTHPIQPPGDMTLKKKKPRFSCWIENSCKIIINYSSKLFIEKYKFSSSDSEYSCKTSLDAIWTSQIGDGHLTLSWYSHTILGIAGYTGRIRTWDLDILILLKISHVVQVKPSKLDNFDFFTAGFSKSFWVVLPN